MGVSLRKKCPYSELFLFVFSCIRTEYREILRATDTFYTVFTNEKKYIYVTTTP